MLCCVPWVLTNVIYVVVLCSMRVRSITVQSTNHAVHYTSSSVSQNASVAIVSARVEAPHHSSVPTNNAKCRKINKVNKVIGYLLLVLNISILLPIVMFSMILRGHKKSVPALLQSLYYFNSISNPFIYSLSIAPLREELKSKLSRLQSVIMCKNG